MVRFIRHPIHRMVIVVVLCAGLLGYALPDVATSGAPASGALAAGAFGALAVTGWRAVRAAKRRRGA
jgi:protein-S-isoprenylcysteine O-methyltransferase Ste14